MTDGLKDIEVLVLAGGLGTRIRGVLGQTPKVLAPIGDKAYLDYLLEWFESFGARRVVLALGYRAEAVQAHLAARPVSQAEVVCVVEPEPLGTAGAIAFARRQVHGSPVLVMNGDSFIGADLSAFVAAHRTAGASASVLCATVPDAGRFGRVEVSPQGRILRFAEKDPNAGPGMINAGIYLFEDALFQAIAEAQGPSLEKDVFEALPPGTLAAFPTDAPFIDIGTPESLERAEAFFKLVRTGR